MTSPDVVLKSRSNTGVRGDSPIVRVRECFQGSHCSQTDVRGNLVLLLQNVGFHGELGFLFIVTYSSSNLYYFFGILIQSP